MLRIQSAESNQLQSVISKTWENQIFQVFYSGQKIQFIWIDAVQIQKRCYPDPYCLYLSEAGKSIHHHRCDTRLLLPVEWWNGSVTWKSLYYSLPVWHTGKQYMHWFMFLLADLQVYDMGKWLPDVIGRDIPVKYIRAEDPFSYIIWGIHEYWCVVQNVRRMSLSSARRNRCCNEYGYITLSVTASVWFTSFFQGISQNCANDHDDDAKSNNDGSECAWYTPGSDMKFWKWIKSIHGCKTAEDHLSEHVSCKTSHAGKQGTADHHFYTIQPSISCNHGLHERWKMIQPCRITACLYGFLIIQ